MDKQTLKETVKRFPLSPGVYVMKNAGGQVIYVGKAILLRDRVSSYFGSHKGLTAKTILLMEEVCDIDYFTVNNGQEALILELNLIKLHHPHYNIALKDGHTYPYIKVDIKTPYPRFWATRNHIEDGGLYFGPFSSAFSVRQTLNLIKDIFPFRSCRKDLKPHKNNRPCLEYHIKRCSGPCMGVVSQADYMESIKKSIAFLQGKHNAVIKDLQIKMNQASQNMQYEKAAFIRDQIAAVKDVAEGQKISAKSKEDQDVLASYIEKDTAAVQAFFVRSGALTGREAFILQGVEGESEEKVLEEFIKLFYSATSNVPALITVYQQPTDYELLQEWLKGKRGTSVAVKKPKIGPKMELAASAYKNAKDAVERYNIKHMLSHDDRASQGLVQIQETLGMNKLPKRVECYDISNTQGTLTVASMSVFIDGKPKISDYRRFRIRRGDTPDDFASIKEVIARRLSRLGDEDFADYPDLILIDGGKGQLSSAQEAFNEAGIDDIFLASIAKEQEEIFIRGRLRSICLPQDSVGLLILRHIRDEAHRFAISYHRDLRAKKSTASALDNVPEIGPVRRRALIKYFGSVNKVRQANVEELTQVSGINLRVARLIKEFL
ncbi:MAG: excinuclease ABC subunit UvrC [Chloroflexi bacterium]|nr:excinuclease ABC subunit UvrC [Chloroflexota bacterium]